MKMQKPKIKFDGLLSRYDPETIIWQKLSLLRQKHRRLKWRLVRGQNFLGFWKRFLFARGLILTAGWHRSFTIFIVGSGLVLSLVVGLRFLDSSVRSSKQILGAVTTGFNYLDSGNFVLALKSAEQLEADLVSQDEALFKILNALPGNLRLSNFFEVAQKLSSAWQSLRVGLEDFQNLRFGWNSATSSSDQEFYTRLQQSRENLGQAQAHLDRAIAILSGINPELLPADFRSRFQESLEKLILLEKAATQIIRLETFILHLLGGESKTYLLIFQNNNEARATGGFIGTYGILEFTNGTIKLSKIESIYALDGQLLEKIAAPGPLQRQVSNYWALRDSNWFADFPTSSRKMLEFLEKEGKILAQGVISFTPNVFEKLLLLTGPVEMPEYGVILTAENFRDTVQEKTSYEYDRESNQPKKFLADFAPRFLEKLGNLDSQKSLQVFSSLYEQVLQKQILMFSLDPVLQQTIFDFGLDGSIKTTPGDYLAIYHSNVGGGKTDQKITQKVEKKVSLDSGGLAIVRLKITRSHEGFDEKFFPVNLDFMRFFVPLKAKLLSASGFDDFPLLPSTRLDAATDSELLAWDQTLKRDEISGMYIGQEAGHEVICNWLELVPGETKTVELVYEVSLGTGKAYTQLLQKQPGSLPFEFDLDMNYLPGKVTYFYPDNFSFGADGHWRVSEIVDKDRFYGLVGE